MKRLGTSWCRATLQAAAVAMVTAVVVFAPGRTGLPVASGEEFIRTRTLFNLAGEVRAYLSLDFEQGTPVLSKTSSQQQSGTYWELRPVGRHRGYRVHLLVQRGNSRFNERYLAVNAESGQLMMTDDTNAENCKWLVRYAGRYQGYDAYYVQMLGKTESQYDLAFLSVDEQNGVTLHPHEPLASAHWRMRSAPHLPTDIIR